MSNGRRPRATARALTVQSHRVWWMMAILPILAALAGCEGAPAAEGESGYGYVCHAGFYQCTLPTQVPLGSRCSCPGLGAPSYGRVG